MTIIKLLRDNMTREEFKLNLVDLIYKNAENNNEIGRSAYIQVPESKKIIGKNDFKHNKKLLSIILPQNINLIEQQAFEYCSNLKTIIFPKYLKYIGSCAFCSLDVTHLSIPDSVVSIYESAFSSCTELKSIIIPNNVRHLGAFCFGNCRQLTDVCLSPKLR